MIVYSFSKILSNSTEIPLTWPETQAATSYPNLQQLLIFKVRFPISVRTAATNAVLENPNSQCKRPKNSSISPVLSANPEKDSCYWFEQCDALSVKIEKKTKNFFCL